MPPRLAILHFFLSSASWTASGSVQAHQSAMSLDHLLASQSQGRSLQPFPASLSLQVVYLSSCRRRLLSSLLKVRDHGTTHPLQLFLSLAVGVHSRRCAQIISAFSDLLLWDAFLFISDNLTVLPTHFQ